MEHLLKYHVGHIQCHFFINALFNVLLHALNTLLFIKVSLLRHVFSSNALFLDYFNMCIYLRYNL